MCMRVEGEGTDVIFYACGFLDRGVSTIFKTTNIRLGRKLHLSVLLSTIVRFQDTETDQELIYYFIIQTY